MDGKREGIIIRYYFLIEFHEIEYNLDLEKICKGSMFIPLLSTYFSNYQYLMIFFNFNFAIHLEFNKLKIISKSLLREDRSRIFCLHRKAFKSMKRETRVSLSGLKGRGC